LVQLWHLCHCWRRHQKFSNSNEWLPYFWKFSLTNLHCVLVNLFSGFRFNLLVMLTVIGNSL
jgi:hypothetical protein